MSWDWILDNSIALIALLVAIWSAWYTKKYSGKQTEIQQKALEIEQKRERDKIEESKKAKFDVNMIKRTNSKGRSVYDQIRLVNTGKSDARNIRWKINNTMPSEFQSILDTDPAIDHIDRIRSGTAKVTKVATDKDSNKIWVVKLSWHDRASKNNNDEFELRL